MLTSSQKYAFQTTGMLIVRNFYSEDIIDRMRRSMDASEIHSLCFHKDPEVFMEFMSHPWIIECCSRFIGLWFRFDHELAVSQTIETKPYLHGGQFGSQGTCFHHQIGEYSWNGQLTVGLCITHQDWTKGGFSYIPGSQNCILGGQYGSQYEIWQEVMDDDEIVRTPELNPGDLYVFSEAIVHGQRQWSHWTPRQAMYLKYVPGYMAWQDYEVTEKYYQWAKTPVQKALLERPFVRNGNYASKDFRESIRKKIDFLP